MTIMIRRDRPEKTHHQERKVKLTYINSHIHTQHKAVTGWYCQECKDNPVKLCLCGETSVARRKHPPNVERRCQSTLYHNNLWPGFSMLSASLRGENNNNTATSNYFLLGHPNVFCKHAVFFIVTVQSYHWPDQNTIWVNIVWNKQCELYLQQALAWCSLPPAA